MNDKNEQIILIKEQIYELTEYLHSDNCRACGEIAIKLDSYINQLKNLLDDTNS